MTRTVDPPFVSKPEFKSTLGPGARGVGVGVTVGVVDVEEMMLVEDTSGVDDTRDEDETVTDEEIIVLLTETSEVAEELMMEVLKAMMLDAEGVGEGATRVSWKTAVDY
jgi:hypothetical protein